MIANFPALVIALALALYVGVFVEAGRARDEVLNRVVEHLVRAERAWNRLTSVTRSRST